MDIEKLRQLRSCLKEHNQEHLLNFWDKLDEEQQAKFYADLNSINYAAVNQSFQRTLHKAESEKGEKKDENIEPVPPEQVANVARAGNKLETWRERGLQEISDGKVAVLLLAGGQGTRLGVPYPKGMYDVGLPSGKTLYQIQAERILKVQELAYQHTGKRSTIPWYIMTSEHTMENTQSFFEEHNFFKLQKEDVIFFEQHTLPCLTFDGKIILDEPGKVARAPDGNGGLYKALGDKHIDGMRKRGLEYLHVYCVDNILVKMADPVFIGVCCEMSAQCGAKVVEKTNPSESVGLVVKCNGRYEVVEYSEMSKQLQEKRDPDGKLTFRDGNICNHFFTLDFLESIVRDHEGNLKFHVAKKKIPYVNENGERIKPDKPTGVKLEKFVFDVFEFAEKFVVLEVERSDEFSPLKNGKGSPKDSPDTARQHLLNLHYRYIVDAGGKFIDDNKGSSTICEISPLLSYAGEGLEEKLKDRTFPVAQPIHLKADDEEENGEPVSKKIKEC